jgi:hypothetical protein
MGGLVQCELLVMMKLLPCHSPEIGVLRSTFRRNCFDQNIDDENE